MAIHISLGQIYEHIYQNICGKSPHLNILHFRWHAARELNNVLRDILPKCKGRMLDYGCGEKPYRAYMTNVNDYVGADIIPELKPDILITDEFPLPHNIGNFDCVLCTQVMEHVKDHRRVLKALLQSLAPGGTLILSVPFIYNVHDAPHDYRRFSEFGIISELGDTLNLSAIHRQGGVGSTICILLLNWLDTALNANRFTRLLKGAILPLTLPITLVINSLGFIMDKADFTNTFYHNVLVVMKKS